MEEIRLNIPEGCKAVTVKVDGGKVITEFEPKEKFEPKDGDIVAYSHATIGIFKKYLYSGKSHEDYATLYEGDLSTGITNLLNDNLRLATEEEKQRLFDAIAKEGYRWNPEKKELEELPRWRAEGSRDYFFISEDSLEVTSEKEVFDEVDDARHKARNYFRTREAAERVAKQIREIFKDSKAE